MPIQTQYGTAKGMFGGYVAGKQLKQEETRRDLDNTGKEISNRKSNAEFLHYVNTRKEAKTILKGQASLAQTTIDTEAPRTVMTEEQAKADTATARNVQALAKDDLYAQKMNMQRKAAQDMMGMNQDRVNAVAEIFGGLGDTDGEAASITDEQYQSMYSQALQVLGKDSDKFLEGYGIGPENSPEAIAAMESIRTQAVHNMDTQIKEHLINLEGQLAIDLALAKSNGVDMDSVIGKMIGDRRQSVAMMEHYPVGSAQWKKAQAEIALYDSAIKSHLDQKAVDAETAKKADFDTFLVSQYPSFANDMENDTGETIQANQFIRNMYNAMKEVYSPEMAQQIIGTMYEYDPGIGWGSNNFELKTDIQARKYMAELGVNLEMIHDTVSNYKAVSSMGKSQQDIWLEAIREIQEEKDRRGAQIQKDLAEQSNLNRNQ